MQYKEYILTSQNEDSMKIIKAVQSDTGRSLKIKLIDTDMTNVTSAKIYVLKPDETEVYNNCTISNGIVTAPLTAQTLAVPGMASAQIQLYDGDTYITSYVFAIEILKSLVSSAAVVSTNEFGALQSLMYKAGVNTVDSMAEMTDINKTYFLSTNYKVYFYNSVTQQWEVASPSMQSAAEEISSLSVSAHNVATGGNATATKTKVGDIYNIDFGLPRGAKGDIGDDGYSPTANVVKTNNKATITITDKNGTTTADVYDGAGLINDVQVDSVSVVSGGIANIQLSNALSPITSVIPQQATSSNQLADKAFVNSSIGTNTSYYISNNGEPFTSLAQLQAYTGTVTNNDYAFVSGEDSHGNSYYDRYKATVSGLTITWAKEYRLNNSSFTAVQWDAVNSGATDELISQITTNQNAITALEGSKLDSDDLIDIIYPVGSVLTLTNNVDPNTLYAGTTWTKIQDTFLLGQGSTYATLGGTGGSADAIVVSHSHNAVGAGAHTHTAYSAGNHNHSTTSAGSHSHTAYSAGNHNHSGRFKFFGNVTSATESSGYGMGRRIYNQDSYNVDHQNTYDAGAHTHSTDSQGNHSHTANSNGAHTHSTDSQGNHSHTINTSGSSGTGANMPPYKIVAFWERTA